MLFIKRILTFAVAIIVTLGVTLSVNPDARALARQYAANPEHGNRRLINYLHTSQNSLEITVSDDFDFEKELSAFSLDHFFADNSAILRAGDINNNNAHNNSGYDEMVPELVN